MTSSSKGAIERTVVGEQPPSILSTVTPNIPSLSNSADSVKTSLSNNFQNVISDITPVNSIIGTNSIVDTNSSVDTNTGYSLMFKIMVLIVALGLIGINLFGSS